MRSKIIFDYKTLKKFELLCENHSLKPQEVFANLDFQAAPGNDVEAARQCVRHALNCAAQAFADQGGSKNLAVLFQADSLSAEIEFKDQFLQTGCTPN